MKLIPQLATLAALVLAPALGGSVTRASAQVPERVIDQVGRPTAITAYGDVAVWSAFDEATRRYALHAWSNGAVVALAVAERSVPFDADVGPDAHGNSVVVYSRCRKEPDVSASFDSLPSWAFGRGCDIYRYRFSDGREQRLKVAASVRRSEVVPSIWRSRLAYFSVSEPRGRPRAIVARLAMGGLTPGSPRRWYAGGTKGPLDRYGKTLIDGPSPSSLDLRGTTAAFGWTNLRTCGNGDQDSGGGWNASEVWQQTARSHRRIAHSCTAYGVYGPSWHNATIGWLRQQQSLASRGSDVLAFAIGATTVLPPFASGTARVGSELFVAHATETTPTQIVAIPAPS
jgi:hypothetical protein